jgi:dipeptidyl aminopeptidase/acylaminoacyl peptidase
MSTSTSISTPPVAPSWADHRMPSLMHAFNRATRPIRAAAKTAVFFLKVLPMLPSKPVNWVTSPPVIERVRYPTRLGQAEGELYRPSTGGPYPGIVMCLGVVPFGVDHPQVPRLEEALARSGLAALIYWSPAMRDLWLDPEDIENIALAYQWLLEQPYVDPARSGLFGTCVGGSFALMAAASPLIRDRVAFVGALAPYSSMWTFAQDIASSTRPCEEVREPWQVDQLARKVYVHSLTALLESDEAERLRSAFTDQGGHLDSHDLSADGQAIYPLLTALGVGEVETALHRLPPAMQERLTALSPLSYLRDMHAPVIVFGHDRDDEVIPVSESRRLWSALSGRAGVRYTEFALFQHMDPTKRKLPLLRLVQQFGKFYLFLYRVFRQAAAT